MCEVLEHVHIVVSAGMVLDMEVEDRCGTAVADDDLALGWWRWIAAAPRPIFIRHVLNDDQAGLADLVVLALGLSCGGQSTAFRVSRPPFIL
ncbi:hypothetical protein BST10_18020 [Mycolicibacter algericus DSM 45454]|uniref:Uncharacterized protein n=1 Tax=Mycolicibacter algericus DSM 45454 TaxID=723879 RepID=A0ABX3RKL2_MYCAL|nr:hypothetical protein BST10_18020 [Mycolicibacter algericus DSM 45454]